MYLLDQPEPGFAALAQADMKQGRMILPQPRYRKAFVLNMPCQFGQRSEYSRISGPQTWQLSRLLCNGQLPASQRRGKCERSLFRCRVLRRRAKIQVHAGSVLRHVWPGRRIQR
jgi:hypothetical protein